MALALEDDAYDDMLFDAMVDTALDNLQIISKLPHLIDEDSNMLMSIYKIWAVDAAALAEAACLSGVSEETWAAVHDRCMSIFDRIEELRHTTEN